MPRREREGGRERGREGEISDIKKAPLLRRAALKMNASIAKHLSLKTANLQHYRFVSHILVSLKNYVNIRLDYFIRQYIILFLIHE